MLACVTEADFLRALIGFAMRPLSSVPTTDEPLTFPEIHFTDIQKMLVGEAGLEPAKA